METLFTLFTRPPVIVRRLTTVLTLASTILLLGCSAEKRQQAKNLVKLGTTTTQGLAEYYETLAKYRAAHLRMSTLENSIVPGPVNAPNPAAYREQIEALNARATMVRKLNSVYDSLGKLIDYDAGTEISGAAIDLKGAIEEVAQKKLSIPFLPDVDPDIILSKAIKELVNWYQLRQFEKNAPKARVIVDSILELYDRESPIYLGIAKTHFDTIRINLIQLIDDNEIGSAVAMSDFATQYGVQMVNTAVLSDARKRYLKFDVQQQSVAFVAKSKKTNQQWNIALATLSSAHRTLFKKTRSG